MTIQKVFTMLIKQITYMCVYMYMLCMYKIKALKK